MAQPLSPLSSAPSSTTPSRRNSHKSLTLDLSSLPPLVPPTLPSNTLLLTNLLDPLIFRADNLQTIQSLIATTAPIHTFSPLKSFRRIIVSFFSDEDAIAVRKVWDGEAVMGTVCRVYFGQVTKLGEGEGEGARLALPDAGKLFFISPPPSPPHDWEMRLEGAPNKEVHAEDLASALAKLSHTGGGFGADPRGDLALDTTAQQGRSPGAVTSGSSTRSRSSTLIFSPVEGGSGPKLPFIAVDDTTMSEGEDDDLEVEEKGWLAAREQPIMAHTARPPVELM